MLEIYPTLQKMKVGIIQQLAGTLFTQILPVVVILPQEGHSLSRNTAGSWNTGNGENSLNSNTTGVANTAIGSAALEYNTIGSYNTATGYKALHSVKPTATGEGEYNIALGHKAGENLTTGSNNIIIGATSMLPVPLETTNSTLVI